MIDDDIRELAQRERAVDLGRMEADIWRREAALRTRRRATRWIAACQGVLLGAGVVGSATAGFNVALHSPPMRPTSLTMSWQNLTPSALLFSGHR